MNTMARVTELANERNLSFRRLATLCEIPYDTLKSTSRRGGQLTVDTIEKICKGLGISMSEFFAAKEV